MHLLGIVFVLAMAGGPRAAAPRKSPPAEVMSGGITGNVVQTMAVGSYTYVEVEGQGKRLWAAAPPFKVKAGDKVAVPPGLPMRNFRSTTLNRTFDVVYFVEGVRNLSAAGSLHGGGHPAPQAQHQHAAVARADTDFSGIRKPDGGRTVAEIHARKADLAGQEIVVQAKVVKATPNVMGRNWIHVQDGTGSGPDSDLTVTSATEVNVDDIVTVRGVLAVDRDLGHGMRYGVIVENAVVTVEPQERP